MISGNNI